MLDSWQFWYFDYQIFTEHLPCANKNIYCMVSRRNEMSFTTDTYGIVRDIRCTDTDTERHTHALSKSKEVHNKVLIWQYSQKMTMKWEKDQWELTSSQKAVLRVKDLTPEQDLGWRKNRAAVHKATQWVQSGLTPCLT